MARVAVYGRTDEPAVTAVGAGFEALGAEVVYQRPSVWASGPVPRVDLAVVHGLRLHNGKLAEHFRGQGVPVFVLDLPPIRIPGYFALWADHVNNLPESRPEDRLGMVPDYRHPSPSGQRVLVCGQTRGDTAHKMGPDTLRDHYRRVLGMLREKLPAARIVWRPHPEWPIAAPASGTTHSDPEASSLVDELRHPDLGAVVTINSTCGVLSLAAGIPTFCDASAFYAGVADTHLPAERNPRPDAKAVRKLLARLSYVQWTVAEFAGGEPQRHCLEALREAA